MLLRRAPPLDLLDADGRFNLRGILAEARRLYAHDRAPEAVRRRAFMRMPAGWPQPVAMTWSECLKAAWQAAKSRRALLRDMAFIRANPDQFAGFSAPCDLSHGG